MASTEPLPTTALGVDGWTIRPWRESDATALATHANNVNVWRWMSDSVAAALTQRAFADPQITRVFAPVHAGNQRSMRVAEKNGFVLEDARPNSAIRAGEVINRWACARTRS